MRCRETGCGFESRALRSANDVDGNDLLSCPHCLAADALHSGCAHWHELAQVDPRLIELIQVWSEISEEAKERIQDLYTSAKEPSVA